MSRLFSLSLCFILARITASAQASRERDWVQTKWDSILMLCLSIMAGKWTLARAKPCLIILKSEEKVFLGSGVGWVYQANQFRVSDATFCSSWDVRSNLGPEAYIKNSIIMFKLHNNKQAFRSGSCTFVEFTPHFYTLARDY